MIPDDKFDVNKKFKLTTDGISLKRWFEQLQQCADFNPNDRICVVSIIGKSPSGYRGCKAAAVDEAIGRNVFREKFAEKGEVEDSMGTKLEAFYDVHNKIMFLHLVSTFDVDVMSQVTQRLDRELKEKGFLQVWTDLQLDIARSLLFLFAISHIVITVHPSVHFDLNYLHLFRVLDMARIKALPYVTDVLSEIESLPRTWIESGRPCSPRMLFVFEAFHLDLKDKCRQYELQLEDQIYRFLRKSRIITNICANSLFAICNQMDFVYMATKDSTIRNPTSYLSELLVQYCMDRSVREEQPERPDEKTFYSFLWEHINVAITKGFDDNVGRHNVISVFELPTMDEFVSVVDKVGGLLFDSSEADSAQNSRLITNHLRSCLDSDTRFSESRCSKALPIAINIYQEGLPTHYTREMHERKLAQALQSFSLHARGPAVFDYATQLREECERFWKNGRQMYAMGHGKADSGSQSRRDLSM